ncbi:unnamed protein product [Gordionus sp. m RMFG-2023]
MACFNRKLLSFAIDDILSQNKSVANNDFTAAENKNLKDNMDDDQYLHKYPENRVNHNLPNYPVNQVALNNNDNNKLIFNIDRASSHNYENFKPEKMNKNLILANQYSSIYFNFYNSIMSFQQGGYGVLS